MSHLINDGGVCRTAPATPGLLTSLLCIVGELAGGGSVAVAVLACSATNLVVVNFRLFGRCK